jgi:hypothetical protein
MPNVGTVYWQTEGDSAAEETMQNSNDGPTAVIAATH